MVNWVIRPGCLFFINHKIEPMFNKFHFVLPYLFGHGDPAYNELQKFLQDALERYELIDMSAEVEFEKLKARINMPS